MKKKKFKTLKDIHKRHQNLIGLLNQDPGNPLGNYTVSLELKDNNDLMLNITSHDSVCRVLELVLNILPHSQMDFMDYVTEKLNGLNNAKTKSSE